jgi:hypothetical protein
MDRWLADRVPSAAADLGGVSRRAASFGITGFTDATPGATERDLASLADSAVAQRLACMAPVGVRPPVMITLGPVKIMLDDATLPPLRELADHVRDAHAAGRPAAVHCVTRVQLVLALAALDLAGRLPGDRIEHGAIIPAELLPDLRGLTVVTQPHFVAERGEQYASDVAPDDLPDLWRLRSLIDAGVPVAGGSDAPFGGEDGTAKDLVAAYMVRLARAPWRVIERIAPKVIVYAHEACIGAGTEITAYAGRVIASPDAFFALPEVRMGLVPGAGGSVSVPRRIGRWRAAWLMLTGDQMPAPAALHWGLADEIGNFSEPAPGSSLGRRLDEAT